MKKIFRIFSIIFGTLLMVIILLLVIAKLEEKKIADIALKKVSESIKAPIRIGDISLSLLRKFPLATIEFKDVWLGSPNTVDSADSLTIKDKTLAKIKKVFVSVKSIPLFKGEFEIMKVEINGVDFNYIVNGHGTSNFDFLNDTTKSKTTVADTTSSNISIMLKELLLRDVHCNYYDSANLMSAQIEIPKIDATGKILKDYTRASTKGLMKLTNCNYKTSTLHLMKEMDVNFYVVYTEGSVDVKKLVLSTDGAIFDVVGSVNLKDTLETNIKIAGTKINIARLFKYIPKQTLKDIGLKDASGLLNLKVSIQGIISDSVLPAVKMEFGMENGIFQEAGYPILKNISFKGYLTNGKLHNNKTTSVDFSKFHAETDKSRVDTKFSIKNLDHIQYSMNSDIEADLTDFKNFIPDSVLHEAKGQIGFKFATNGVLPDSVKYDFMDYVLKTSQMELTLKNLYLAVNSSLSLDSLSGHLKYESNHLTAQDLKVKIPSYKINVRKADLDVYLSGKPSQIATLGIDLKSFMLKTDKSTFAGVAKIKNIKAPEFNMTSNIKLDLNEISALIPKSVVKKMSGGITAQISSFGKLNLDSILAQMNDLLFKNSSFSVIFDKVSLDMPDTLMSIKVLSGKLKMKHDTMEINNAGGIYCGIDFKMDSTKIVNFYSAFMENHPLQFYIDGRFDLGDLDYRMLASFMSGNTDTVKTIAVKQEGPSATSTTDNTTSKYSYLIKGKITAKTMKYKKVVLENLSTLLNVSDSLYIIDQFKFNAFGGKLNTSIKYSNKGEKKTLWVKNTIDDMNITKLLEDFDNFKDFYEPTITSKNLSGIITSSFDGQFLYKGDSLIRNEMRVRADVKLEKGGVYDYQPVKDMAKYLPGVDNLDKLEFKTINSQFFIFKDAVYVPKTLIISNGLDAEAFGMKSLGEDYSYHIEVFLKDILLGKSKKLIKEQNNQGEEISKAGRKGILLKSYSIGKKSGNGLDNKDDREIMQNKIRASESLLNVRFLPQIVNYNTGVYTK